MYNTQINKNFIVGPFGKQNFGSNSQRFDIQNMNEKRQKKLPGPGYYYGYSAINYNPTARY